MVCISSKVRKDFHKLDKNVMELRRELCNFDSLQLKKEND
jgi:mRNA-degrading endonuclease RelE of RelBE toxin-antitoxin system